MRLIALVVLSVVLLVATFVVADRGLVTVEHDLTQLQTMIGAMHSEDSQGLALHAAEAERARRIAALGLWGTFALAFALLALVVHVTRREAGRLRRHVAEQQSAERTLRLRESELRIISDYARFPIARCDPEHRYLFVNRAYADRFNVTPEQCVGRHLRDIAGEAAYQRVRVYADAALAGQVADFEAEIPYAVLGPRYMRCVYAPERDSAGIVRSFVAAVFDISDRRAAEIALRDRERQFAGLANAIPQLAFTTNSQGHPDYFNRGWYAYTGLSETESLGPDGWARVLHPADEPSTRARWMESLKSGTPYETESRLRRYDGAYRWFLIRAIADRGTQGDLLQWFGTCTDIDATKRTEERLRETEAALREADLRKDVFLAVLSHELRNPLAPIRTAARLLESPRVGPGELQQIRTIISRQVAHMTSLLEDLLDVSRITRGVLALKKSYVPLRLIFEAAIESAQPLIDAKEHRLSVEWPAESVILEADSVRLTQVLANLLTNAAKYTNAGGEIRLDMCLTDDLLAIRVRDSGVGLPPEMRSKVFEMFAQIDPDQTRSEEGLGIGLAIVKGIVELHGGRVEAQSSGLGQGSEFTVWLPCPRMGAEATGELPDTRTEAPPHRTSRILIADDNRDAAESLRLLLELSGHQVRVANCGRQALETAAQWRPEVGLLDIGMPDLDGYEVAKRIRREAWGAEITLIALTGWGQDDDRREARAAGFDHHLTKPMDPVILERILSQA